MKQEGIIWYQNQLSEILLAVEMRRTRMHMNKPTFLSISTLEMSKVVMCEFWYDYVKRKYGEEAKLC